jgi:hypothetical protein
MPLGPSQFVEIPNPHLERLIPEATRNFWAAAALLPWILARGRLGNGKPNESAQQSDGAPLSKSPFQQPPNGGGSPLPWYVGPPVLEEERRRSALSKRSEGLDPNFRQLTREPTPDQEARSAPPDFVPSFPGWLAQARKSRKFLGGSTGASNSFGKNTPKSKTGNSGGGYKGGARNTGGDDDDYCTRRMYQERDECMDRWGEGEYAQPDHYRGCIQRATDRWDACNRNGGTPPPWESKKWSLDPDEEVYINPDR